MVWKFYLRMRRIHPLSLARKFTNQTTAEFDRTLPFVRHWLIFGLPTDIVHSSATFWTRRTLEIKGDDLWQLISFGIYLNVSVEAMERLSRWSKYPSTILSWPQLPVATNCFHQKNCQWVDGSRIWQGFGLSSAAGLVSSVSFAFILFLLPSSVDQPSNLDTGDAYMFCTALHPPHLWLHSHFDIHNKMELFSDEFSCIQNALLALIVEYVALWFPSWPGS